jgi:hypothetical protein
MKLEFSRQIFEKYSNVKFHEKYVNWEPSCFMWTDRGTDRRRDRHDEANNRLSQFCERA